MTAAICAALISFCATPIARVIAYKIGAIDVPKDNRRMHKKSIPRLGGLAVFFAFVVATVVFCDFSPATISILAGGFLIVVIGVIDDVYCITPLAKLLVQILAAVIPVLNGVTINFFSFAGNYYDLGIFSIPLTIVWIVGLTNAVNLIDGLDGLACGVSAICSLSMLLATISLGAPPSSVMLCGILAGSCLGFLPFNLNPAKIFIGDTGALFLGYTMSIISIDGVIKVHATLSFIIPLLAFGFPIFDTIFAIIRRVAHGHAPWYPDKGHIHHRLIAMGFNQKQSVGILYAVSALLGLTAVMFTGESMINAGIIFFVGLAILIAMLVIMKNPKLRKEAGFIPDDETKSADDVENNDISAEKKDVAKAGIEEDLDNAIGTDVSDDKEAHS